MSDLFDTLLNKTCTILERDPEGAVDAYNQPDETLTTLEANVRCNLSNGGRGREFQTGKRGSIGTYLIFMRPTTVSEHNVIEIEGIRYNILDVDDPGGLGHHLELTVEKLKP